MAQTCKQTHCQRVLRLRCSAHHEPKASHLVSGCNEQRIPSGAWPTMSQLRTSEMTCSSSDAVSCVVALCGHVLRRCLEILFTLSLTAKFCLARNIISQSSQQRVTQEC